MSDEEEYEYDVPDYPEGVTAEMFEGTLDVLGDLLTEIELASDALPSNDVLKTILAHHVVVSTAVEEKDEFVEKLLTVGAGTVVALRQTIEEHIKSIVPAVEKILKEAVDGAEEEGS